MYYCLLKHRSISMKILLIEDEEKVAGFIQRGLQAEGFSVDVASDGERGERKLRRQTYDLLILDLLLPKKDGFEIIKSLRTDKSPIPILVLTARSATEDIVKGLELGADDYLVKPFAFSELVARLRSLARRDKTSSIILKLGDLQLDTVRHQAVRNGVTIPLTRREYNLLEFFLRHPYSLVTRRQLEEEVWGYDYDPGTNIVDVYINHLRKKIDHAYNIKLIHSVRGRGYIFTDRSDDLKKY